MNQKGGIALWVSLVVVGAIVLLGFGVGFRYYLSEKPVQEVEEGITQPAVDETMGWEIYRNDDYGFEVKHPENYILSEGGTKSNDKFVAALIIQIYDPENTAREFGPGLSIWASRQPSRGPIFSTTEELFSFYQEKEDLLEIKGVNLNGIYAIESLFYYDPIESRSIRVLKGEFIYSIIWNPPDHFYFSDIASTFKFIDIEGQPAVDETLEEGVAQIPPRIQGDCSQEKAAVVENYQDDSVVEPIVLTGQVDFPNNNYPLSSLTVRAGVIDESRVRADGTFCLVSNKSLRLVLVTVGFDEGVILMALATPRSDQGVFTINVSSTATAMVDFPVGPYISVVLNQVLLNSIPTLPEVSAFTNALSDELLKAPAGTDLATVLEAPHIEPIYDRAIKAVETKLTELTQ